MDAIKQYFLDFAEKAMLMLQQLLQGDMWWVVAIVAVAAVILLIIGLITLIVKSWKVLLVLAILGGIGFAVYYFVWGPGKKGGEEATTTVETIRLYLNILKAIA